MANEFWPQQNTGKEPISSILTKNKPEISSLKIQASNPKNRRRMRFNEIILFSYDIIDYFFLVSSNSWFNYISVCVTNQTDHAEHDDHYDYHLY